MKLFCQYKIGWVLFDLERETLAEVAESLFSTSPGVADAAKIIPFAKTIYDHSELLEYSEIDPNHGVSGLLFMLASLPEEHREPIRAAIQKYENLYLSNRIEDNKGTFGFMDDEEFAAVLETRHIHPVGSA